MRVKHTTAVSLASGVVLEALEARRLLAAAAPTDLEQYLIELINRARADPLAEAARYGIDLNEGVEPGETITPEPKQPLAVNPYLTDAARGHSAWMEQTNTFSHTGAAGSTPTSRMQAAGYVLSPPWTTGENIAWRGTKPSVPEPVATTARLHQDLFVDLNYPGRGHRVNMLLPDFKEVGTGVVTGEFNTFNAVIATEDFAASGFGAFLTGVAFTDAVVADDFYTPGEGIGNAVVTARSTTENAAYSTTTYPSGGYSLKLKPGTYDLVVTGVGAGTIVRPGVTIGSQNVKQDFEPGQAVTPAVTRRAVFYNNSSYDGRTPAAVAADLNAVAPDKSALRPGQTATFANVTSYVKGINGVLVDLQGARPGSIGSDDFIFRVGRAGNPATWVPAPAPASVAVISDAANPAIAHCLITWTDGAIVNQWLQVTVKANQDTGLAAPDVFYIGNLIAETGDTAGVFRVNALDLAGTRSRLGGQSSLDGRYDFDRDGRVTALDLTAVRRNLFQSIETISVSA